MIRSRTFSVLLVPIILGGCAVGPDYFTPRHPLSASGPFISKNDATAPESGSAQTKWWRLYNDPTLDMVVGDALAANTEVRVAVARLSRARANLQGASADRFPDADISADLNRQRQSANQVLPGAERENTGVDLGLSVAYELDLFGRVRRNVEAAKGDYQAAEADLDAVRVSTVAATTRAYLGAVTAAQRLAVAERIVMLLDRSIAVTKRREEAGLTTQLDTARITALRDQRRSSIPMLIAEREAELYRIALLTGRTPKDLPKEVRAVVTLPKIHQRIPVGDGMALLARRPDVRAAERRLAAETARIGVATSDLYPRVSIGASLGSTSFGFGDAFGAGPLRWLVGPLISWSFPNQQKVRSRISIATADSQAALAKLDGSVLQALSETETALSNYARSLERHDILVAAEVQAGKVAQIVRAELREGRVDSLSLLDAERTYADAQAQLADSEARVANAQVDVFLALGGGWEASNVELAAKDQSVTLNETIEVGG